MDQKKFRELNGARLVIMMLIANGLTWSSSRPDTNFPTEDEIAQATTVAAVHPRGLFPSSAMRSRGESREWVLRLRKNVRTIFSDNLLQRVTLLINGFRNAQKVAWFKKLGIHKHYSETSGCKVFYTKDVRHIKGDDFRLEIRQKKPGGAFLHVFGGAYGDRVEWDFQFVAFPTSQVDGMDREGRIKFGFWLVSSSPDPSGLVLRVRAKGAMMQYAVGALLTVLTNSADGSLVSVTDKYNMHITEVILEFGNSATNWGPDCEEADLYLQQADRDLVSMVVRELDLVKIDVKALMVYKNALRRNKRRMDLKSHEIDHRQYKLRLQLPDPFVVPMRVNVWEAILLWCVDHL